MTRKARAIWIWKERGKKGACRKHVKSMRQADNNALSLSLSLTLPSPLRGLGIEAELLRLDEMRNERGRNEKSMKNT